MIEIKDIITVRQSGYNVANLARQALTYNHKAKLNVLKQIKDLACPLNDNFPKLNSSAIVLDNFLRLQLDRLSMAVFNLYDVRSEDIAAYNQVAVWSSHDDNGNPLDSLDIDLNLNAKACMSYDFAMFLLTVQINLGISNVLTDTDKDLSDIAHDFWLTRNHHGAGFWDGDFDQYGDILTKLARTFSEVSLYVSKNNEIELYN